MSVLKNKYLKFIKKQETSGNNFRDKFNQLNDYLFPAPCPPDKLTTTVFFLNF